MLNLLHKRELEIVGIVRANVKLPKSAYKKLGNRFGLMLIWERLVRLILYGISIVLSLTGRSYFAPGWWITLRHGIPTYTCTNVNEPQSEEFIRSLKPDVIISAYFSQILKPNILNIPRYGVLNVHPGWLPAYKGAMNYFWALKNNEEWGGVTVHWMDEGIDTGAIVARKKFPLAHNITQHQVLIKTAIYGSRLLQLTARKLLREGKVEPIEISDTESNYYSFPTASAFEEYFRTRRFFRIRNAFRLILFHLK